MAEKKNKHFKQDQYFGLLERNIKVECAMFEVDMHCIAVASFQARRDEARLLETVLNTH